MHVLALAMAAIGIDEETIVSDYILSNNGLEPIHREVVKEMAHRGLNPSFADSPPEVFFFFFYFFICFIFINIYLCYLLIFFIIYLFLFNFCIYFFYYI